MEFKRSIVIAVKLQGTNYMVWSNLVKITLEGKGLWSHCVENAPIVSKGVVTLAGGGAESSSSLEKKWQQEDIMVLPSLLSSLAPIILETHCYCESAKEVWSTLCKVYGSFSSTSRVFEIKKAIIDLSQEGEEFTSHLGKLSTPWSKLEILRPKSMDIDVLNKGREQDKLPTLEDVCAQVQKEERTHGLLKTKEGLTIASEAEASNQSNEEAYKKVERGDLQSEHCKKDGHSKERRWELISNLKPAKFK